MDIVLSLSWASAYDSVRGLLRHFAPAWAQVGLGFAELDTHSPGWEGRLRAVLAEHEVRFVLAAGGIGTGLTADGEPLWERLKIPVYALMLDHPSYYAARHRTQPNSTVLGYMFRDHALFQAAHVKAENIVTSIDYGMPDLPLASPPARPRILFAKTGNDPEALAKSWRAAPWLERILRDAVDALALTKNGQANCNEFWPVIAKVAQAHRLEVLPFSLLGRFLLVQVDDYIRRLKSTAMARALLPFEVDVFGRGWEHIETEGAKARFHGAVDYARIEAEFGSATASLTMNPNIALSAHDRFFTALGAGILPISDKNPYLERYFPELLPYSFDFQPGSIEAAIGRVVANLAAAVELAHEIRAKKRAAHGVEQAALRILQAVRTARFLHLDAKPGQDFFAP